jgi:hypothetical protein
MARLKVGLAIGDHDATAVWRDDKGQFRSFTTAVTDASDEGAWRDVFAESRAMLGIGRPVQLFVAILPPLARVRRIVLPPMSAEDARSAIARAPGKHFLGIAEPVVCAVEKGDGGYLAAVVPVVVIDALGAAAAEIGWPVARAVPAQNAWSAQALRRWPALRRGRGEIIVRGDREVSVLQFTNARLALVRRHRASAPDLESTHTLAEDSAEAATVAAEGASGARALEFISDATRRSRSAQARRIANGLAAAAAVCLLAAGGVYRLAQARQLAAIDAERARIKPAVDRAIRVRDSLMIVATTVRSLDSLERTSPRWSGVIGQVARAMPKQAFVAALHAEGDSASMEGQAQNAAEVFGALRTAPGILSVRPTAPIRQEVLAGQPPVERWIATARVDHAATTRGEP